MSKKEKKEKKKKKKHFGGFIFFLVLAGVMFLGYKNFKEEIILFVREQLPFLNGGKKVEAQATPTPTDLKGMEITCYGGEWENLDSNDKKYKEAKEYVEKKYNVVLKKLTIADDGTETDEDDANEEFDILSYLRNTIEKGEPGADIVNIPSSQLYYAYFLDIFPDVTEIAKTFEVGSSFIEAGTWKNKVYGISYDKNRETRFIIYDREYIKSLDLEDPLNLFVKGEWNYDRFEIYLRKLREKIPDNMYPIGVDPYEWLIMASGANGVILLDNDGKDHLLDERVAEAVRFYQKLETDDLAYPMTATYVNGALMGLDIASGIDEESIVLKTASYSELPKDLKKYGIVCFPWGYHIDCEDYFLNLPDNYYMPTTDWTIDAPVKAACEKKDLDPELMTRLIYDYHYKCAEETVNVMTRAWRAETKDKKTTPMFDTGIFDTNADNVVYEWMSERFTTDYSSRVGAYRYAGYDTLCGYSDPDECFGKRSEEIKESLAKPFVSYDTADENTEDNGTDDTEGETEEIVPFNPDDYPDEDEDVTDEE